MTEKYLILFAGILVLGVAAQLVAKLMQVPSILLLLLFGFGAGNLGLLNPDEIFGDLLFPVVSASVAVILFEGGLTLRFKELPKAGSVIRNLISVGAFVAWVLTAAASKYILGLDWTIAILLGAILVVTGPTVIVPLLNHIRPGGKVGPILKWEGIVIDPIGALLAVLVFEAIASAGPGDVAVRAAVGVLYTVILGGGLGVAAAWLMSFVLRRYLVQDSLINPLTLALVLGVFALSNYFQHESGLFAVTVMGVMLANQSRADIRHIVEFKENLRVLLISCLFIVLAARVRIADFGELGWSSIGFVLALILVVRPVSVFVSTLGMGLSRNERLFLAWMAPRGIVAAAVASVFAFKLEAAGHEGATQLVPATFLVIFSTVTVYSLTAPILARRLRLADANPQGILFVGAHAWAREIAAAVQAKGFRVVLVDTNRENLVAARFAGLATYSGSILSEHAMDEIDLSGVGRILAMTPNDEVNALAAHRMAGMFGRSGVYQLCQHSHEDKKRGLSEELRGRSLFGEGATYAAIASRFAAGGKLKSTTLTDEFTFEDFCAKHGDSALPLFILAESGRLEILVAGRESEAKAGQTIISLSTADSAAESA